MTLSFKKVFYVLASLVLMVYIMIEASTILIPISLSMLLSFILYPIHKRLELTWVGSIGGAFISIFIFFGSVLGLLTFFSTELVSLSNQLSEFESKVIAVLSSVLLYLNDNLGFIGNITQEEVIDSARDWLRKSGAALIGSTFGGTGGFLTGLFTVLVYTFLILIYRSGLVRGVLLFTSDSNRATALEMLRNIQKVGQRYLSGMITLIIILGLSNSIGLWIIGLDSPFLFGFLAATLSIIPYVGTILGAILPIIYALISQDSMWMPLAVAGLFWVIQLIESNFLSPKIVGSSVNVNALAAILSLLVGAAIWGIAGMILFLPFMAMLKVICEYVDPLKPIGLMISERHFK
jgi:predicted PurR-regulated permease PerM